MLDRCGVRNEAVGFLKGHEVVVKGVGEIRRQGLQGRVQYAQPRGILGGEFQKGLAPRDLDLVKAQRPHHGLDGFIERFHASRPRPPPTKGR